MISRFLIDAFTVSDGRVKKPCPVSALQMMLFDDEMTKFSEEIKNQALLLLATYRKLLLAVALDLSHVSTLKKSVKKRHWGKGGKVQYKKVVAGELQIKHLDLEEMPIFLNTHYFLNQLPISFVQKLVEWAPPVVSGCFLIENVLTGYIAKKCLPLEKIKVKALSTSLQAYFHLADFCVFLPRLEQLYQKHQQHIVRVAPTADIALALTDLKRARIYQIRSN